ncbi:tetratricopeptide repeat protein [Patescibacteria group bacterium]|nr:MAG: tetratricopeptide repeat protein [Patescibacteria group bacterium]
MVLWLIPLLLLLASVAVLGVIVVRKIPQLRVMETSTDSDERTRRVKEAIILDRVARLQSEKLGRLGRAVIAGGKGAMRLGRLAVQRLYRMEQYYQKLKRAPSHAGAAVGPEAVRGMLEAAEAFAREGEPIQAEKKYIEAISHSPKCAEAYEGLGNLYFEVKQYDQAREALAFALRLSPGDASVHMSLADLDLAEGKTQAALAHLRESVEKRPHNPKYLDRYIETALLAKERKDAEKGIASLKASNPDNQKIPVFEESLSALPEAEPSQEG